LTTTPQRIAAVFLQWRAIFRTTTSAALSTQSQVIARMLETASARQIFDVNAA